MHFKSLLFYLAVLGLFTSLTAQGQIAAAAFSGLRVNDLPLSIELKVTSNKNAPKPKYTIINVPLRKGWKPTQTGWKLSGNANGGGGGSYVKRDRNPELSDEYYAPEKMVPQSVANDLVLKAWGKNTQPEVQLDPNRKLSETQLSLFYNGVLTRGGMMTYKMKDAETIDEVHIYLPDLVYEGLGEHFQYRQFPENVKNELNKLRLTLEGLGLFNDLFWNTNVMNPEVNYRFLSRDDFEKITCEKYVPDLKEEFSEHLQFGCTYGQSTYIVNEILNFEKTNASEMAYALLHERLWSLKPGLPNATLWNKNSSAFVFSVETDVDDRLRTAISSFIYCLKIYMNLLDQRTLNNETGPQTELEKVTAAALKNAATNAFHFEFRPPR